ncbi:18093_t:CDS:2, partial [Rhizophagus irregularis]
NNFKDAILSNLENKEYPFWFSSTAGPYFGNDFVICALNESADYNVTRCSKRFYEKKIRNR